MHERFTPGKHHPLDPQLLNVRQKALKLRRVQTRFVGCLPNVAHRAAAVAACVRRKDENRQADDFGRVQAATAFPARRISGPNVSAVCFSSDGTSKSTK